MIVELLRRASRLSVILLIVILSTGPAPAGDDSPEMRAMRSNCVGDYFRYCAGLNPNGSEVRTCFHGHRASLSRECSAAIDAYERRAPAPAARP